MRSAAGSNRIMIDPPTDHDRWSTPQEMRDNMHFYDRNFDDKRSYSKDKAALTRRAEIIILSKGSCEPIE